MGAGRTELLRAIFGLDPIRRGDVRLLAFHGSAPPPRRWRQGAGMLSEDRKSEGLAINLSIADNLTLSRLSPLIRPVSGKPRHKRGSSGLEFAAVPRFRPLVNYRGETSRKSRSRASCIMTWTCCCLTSPRAALMSRAKRKFTA